MFSEVHECAGYDTRYKLIRFSMDIGRSVFFLPFLLSAFRLAILSLSVLTLFGFRQFGLEKKLHSAGGELVEFAVPAFFEDVPEPLVSSWRLVQTFHHGANDFREFRRHPRIAC